MRNLGAAAVLALSLVATATAGKSKDLGAASSAVHIDNFGKINANYYRGAQPEGQGYSELKALGVKTVIDLQADGLANEKAMVEKAGMKFYRIPMTTSDTPSQAAVTEFLKLVNDPANQPVYVHCKGGRHRTGAMTAAYRMTQDGWDADKAYQEMKAYRFEGFPGHPELKKFVYDYGRQVAANNAAHRAAEAVAAGAPVTVTK
jgi:protein tyrosine/serine phosphatase